MVVKKQYKSRMCVTLLKCDEQGGPRCEILAEMSHPWTDDPKVNSLAMCAIDEMHAAAMRLSKVHPYIFYVQVFDDNDSMWRGLASYEKGVRR